MPRRFVLKEGQSFASLPQPLGRVTSGQVLTGDEYSQYPQLTEILDSAPVAASRPVLTEPAPVAVPAKEQAPAQELPLLTEIGPMPDLPKLEEDKPKKRWGKKNEE